MEITGFNFVQEYEYEYDHEYENEYAHIDIDIYIYVYAMKINDICGKLNQKYQHTFP